MKKFLLLFAALLTLGVSARAADGDEFTVDNLKYRVLSESKQEVALVGYIKRPKDHLSIPEYVNNNERYFIIEIGEDAFNNCRDFTSVTIPNSVTKIGDYAFGVCTGLTSVTIPNSVTAIGKAVFYGCTGLTSVIIPNSVTEIGYGAFEDCTGLTSVDIPNSVAKIGDYAFSGCTDMTSVDIPNSVTAIGAQAFGGCTGLTSVTIPNSVTEIGERAFAHCTGLTSVKIPNSVTAIGESAFATCISLTSVTIPNSVTNIGSYAFFYCTGLTTIIAQPTTPPACGTTSFGEVPQSAVVYIPKGTRNEYAAAEGWNYFTDFREMEDSGIEGVEAGSDNAPAEFFRLNGMRVKGGALAPGVYLKRRGGNVTKVLVK